MKKVKEKIKQFGIIETTVFIIYIILILIIATNHECWEDDAQSWLIARDLNLIEIIKQMKYEGHSFLWYYILVPFAKLGFPVQTQIYISSIFAIITVYIILKKSPFNKLTKILLTFSGGMIYFYSVNPRPYCLIPFLLVCISVVYKDKEKHPYLYATLIALLANTHLIMLPTAFLLTATFWGKKLFCIKTFRKNEKSEKIKTIGSFTIAVLGILCFLIIALFTVKNCEIVRNKDKTDKLQDISETMNLIKDTGLKTIGFLYGTESNEVPKYFIALVGIVMLLLVIDTPRSIKQSTMFWTQFIFTMLIHAFAWFIIGARVYIVIYTLMFWLWNYKDDAQYKKNQKRNIGAEIALIVLIIISAPSIYKLAYQDITENFSTGKITAKYIEDNIPKGACFIYIGKDSQQSIVAYLPKDEYKFYMANSKRSYTFTTWDKEWNTWTTEDDIYNAIDILKPEFENIYIIMFMCSGIPIKNSVQPVEKIYSSEDDIMVNFYASKEFYTIYKIVE